MRYRVKIAFAADVDGDLRKAAANVRGRKKKLVLGNLSLNYADILGV